MNHLDLEKARAVYREGGNVTEFLRAEFNEASNTSEIIEIAYDFQAGSYIDNITRSPERANLYTDELYSLLAPHLFEGCSMLDVGTGELTTLSLMANRLDVQVGEIAAFDISWSRLHKGLGFWHRTVARKELNLSVFVADMKRIPLASNSMDIVTSSHALEPNGQSLDRLLKEIFRVSRGKCVLFEPSYEHNSDEGKKRMDRLGYIKGMEGAVENLGGRLVDFQLLEKTGNPLNPTACFVIEPPQENVGVSGGAATMISHVGSGTHAKAHAGTHMGTRTRRLCVPGTDFPLTVDGDFLVSNDTGLVFPVLKGIPVLKESAAILATSLVD